MSIIKSDPTDIYADIYGDCPTRFVWSWWVGSPYRGLQSFTGLWAGRY